MGDWTPDEQAEAAPDCASFCRAYQGVAPAKVDGAWRLKGGELALTQSYQMLSGVLTRGEQSLSISEARWRIARSASSPAGNDTPAKWMATA